MDKRLISLRWKQWKQNRAIECQGRSAWAHLLGRRQWDTLLGAESIPNSEVVVLADCLATVTGDRPLGCHLLWKSICLWLLLIQARMPGWLDFMYFTCRADDSIVVTLLSLLSYSSTSVECVRKQVSKLPGAQISLPLLFRDFGSIIQPLCWWETYWFAPGHPAT